VVEPTSIPSVYAAFCCNLISLTKNLLSKGLRKPLKPRAAFDDAK